MRGRTSGCISPQCLPHRGHASLVFLICLSLSLTGCRSEVRRHTAAIPADAAGVHSHRTNFPATENPISEGGVWIGGSEAGASPGKGVHFWRHGRLWGDVQTQPGFAFGVDEPTKYGDPTAILAGTWGPVQTVTAVVKVRSTPDKGCCHEVELRLRTTISAFKITGYEAYCSVIPSSPYCHIARWNGPNGSYWNFETHSPETYLQDGDVIKATVTGVNPTVITFYKNGDQIMQAIDTGAAGGGFGAFGPWTSGNPGIGLYDDRDDNWKGFGLASFSATDDPRSAAAN
jgi:hypothetical protein